MMNLEEIALWVDLAASITVVVSFIFIGVQIRQNTHALRMGAVQASVQLLSDNMGRVVESPELAELIVRPTLEDGGEELRPFTPVEQMRLSNFLSISFRHFESIYTHRKYGIFEKELWESTRARLRQTLTRDRVREWWAINRPFYAKSFARFVDAKIAAMEANGDI